MSTKIANAPNTKRIRLRISGTTSAFARLRQIVIGRQLFLKVRAGGFELRSSRRRERDVAEMQAFGSVADREYLHAVLALGDQTGRVERVRRDDFLSIPVFEVAQIDHRILGAEDLRRSRLLRHAAPVRKTSVPGCLAAFEVRTFAAARTRGLALAT